MKFWAITLWIGREKVDILSSIMRGRTAMRFWALTVTSLLLFGASSHPVAPKATFQTQNGAVKTPPTGNESLLSGCTVDAKNLPSCSIPPGWTLVKAQGFENGIGEGEYGYSGCNGVVNAISTGLAHIGTHAWLGHICGDGDDPTWGLNYPQVGFFSDLYVSSWTYLTPGAHIETGNFYFHRFVCCGGKFNQELTVNLDSFGLQPAHAPHGEGNQAVATTTYPWVDFVGQSSCFDPGCKPIGTEIDFSQFTAKRWHLNTGSWQQNETWVHFNSCAGNKPNSDGFYRFYINGQLFISQSNVNLTGCWLMSGQTNVEVGGVATVIITENSSGQCIGGLGGEVPPGGSTPRINPFSSAPALEVDGVTPCVPHVNFQQYADDIIVLKK